jgi:hypothetical protein
VPDRAVELAATFGQHDQAAKDGQDALLPALALAAEPLLETGAVAHLEAVQERAAVECDRRLESVRGGVAAGGQLLEGGQVGVPLGARLPGEGVAEARDREGRPVGGPERAAQAAQRGAEAVAALGLAVLLPEQGDQLAAADRASGVDGQVVEERGRLTGRDEDLLAAQPDARRSEEVDLDQW